MSTNAVSSTPPPPTPQAGRVEGHGRQHRGGHHMRQAMQAVADTLGMSGEDLKAALKSGKSLAEVASEKGVSHDDLVKTVAAALDKARPAGAPQVDTTAMAARIVDHKRGEKNERAEGDGDADDLAKRAVSALGAAAASDPARLAEALKNAPPEIQSLLRAGTRVDTAA